MRRLRPGTPMTLDTITAEEDAASAGDPNEGKPTQSARVGLSSSIEAGPVLETDKKAEKHRDGPFQTQ